MKFIARFFLLVLFLSFGELYLLVKVASHISLELTFLLCVLTGVFGGALVRHQGFRTLSDIQKTTARGQIPATEIVSGLILIVIGTMLLTPGFITDIIAFLLLVPPIRTAAANLAFAYFKKRVSVQTVGFPSEHIKREKETGPASNTRRSSNENVVIEVEAEEID